MAGQVFSYSFPVDPEQYQLSLKRVALNFLRFRATTPVRKAQPLAKAYRAWWMSKGPTNFLTAYDAIRFRNELYTFIEANLAESPLEEPAPSAGES